MEEKVDEEERVFCRLTEHHHHLTNINVALTDVGNVLNTFFFNFFVFLPFLGLLPQHMEVPRLGV